MRKYFTILLLMFSFCASAQITFHWRQLSGPLQTKIINPDSANTLVTGLNQVGIYEFEFSITNEFGTGKDTCSVTVISGVLSIQPDSVYHFQRPEIKKLDIKMIVQGNKILIQIKSPKPQQITCFLYDFMGRKLAKIDMTVNKGTNLVSIPKPRIAGIYILSFETYFDVITQKIMI